MDDCVLLGHGAKVASRESKKYLREIGSEKKLLMKEISLVNSKYFIILNIDERNLNIDFKIMKVIILSE